MTSSLRIGLGHDTHRLEDVHLATEKKPFIIGGIEIPYHQQLVGHSDADVLLHAITDALLGAASLGDIGQMFPNTKSANYNRDSAEMLRLAYEKVMQAGYQIVNLDTVILAEQPKMAPHLGAMKNRIAEILATSPDQIGIKGKTGEKVGPVGREEAIEAQAVALLETIS